MNVTNFYPSESALLTNTELETWDADIVYKTDVFLSDQLWITPVVGITYTKMKLDNDFKSTGINVFVPLIHEINDHTRTHYYGGVLGAELTVRPLKPLSFVAGLRADVMGATSAMKASQEGNSGGSIFRSAESDNDTNFAARATATLGFDLDFGPLTFGAEGYASYLSYLPVADHRFTGSDRPVNIDGSDLWTAGAKLSLTVWLP